MTKLVGCTIALPSSNDLNGIAQLAERLGVTVLRFAAKSGNFDGSTSGSSPLRPAPERVNPDKTPTDGATFALESWLEPLVNDIDDIIVLSPQGIRLLLELASQLHRESQLIRALSGVRRIAYGARPAAALRELGLPASITSQLPTLPSLTEALEEVDLSGRAVGLIPRASDPELLELITGKGGLPRILAPFDDIPISSTLALVESVIGMRIQVLVFSTPEQVREVWRQGSLRHSPEELRQAILMTRVIAIGSTTVRALEQLGIAVATSASSSELACASSKQITDLLALGGFVDLPLVEARMGTPPPEINGVTVERARAGDGPPSKPTIVVIGNGMVGHKLVEKLTDYDNERNYELVVFCEEPRPAYDRVQLTSYFGHRSPDQLLLADRDWYEERGVRLLVGEQAVSIDRERRAVLSSSNEWVAFDYAVICTGSSPFVPTIPGTDKRGVFVYRTIEDLEAIIDYAREKKRAVVLGGGLLGLEAAKAAADLGLETEVVEFASRLMPRQLDEGGARLLARKIEALGLKVQTSRATTRILGDAHVTGVAFNDGSELDTDLVIISAGIRPRDALARQCGLKVGERGGIAVDDELTTSDPRIFAIGECALHREMLYGLVAPGYEMADTVAQILVRRLANTSANEDSSFAGMDQSAKLKLLGVDVASLGDPFADTQGGRAIVYEDLVRGVYKKLVVSNDCKQLLGAILVGDAGEYGQLLHLFRSQTELPSAPEQLILGSRENVAKPLFVMPDTAQVCSCNNVTRGAVCSAIRDKGCATLDSLKSATRVGTGCGGCVPLVTDILNGELRAAGQTIKNDLCEHFAFSRQELYQVVKINKLKSFDELVASHGKGHGCEICKPVVASILASVHNDLILKHATLQDTNDRYLANIQRGGLYSVVPRVPAGEITPNQLIAIGVIAKKYDLYTKITGGQRIDMFGAKLSQLPDIWTDLVNEGFESGHAYGKAMRTVKSCVGSTWCRYGVQDSVAFAIRVEERYKGIRAPHKLKSAVSGCVRECAEAQSKDFGLIATEKGYNLYVCGNGGAKPRHADLLAADLDEDTALRYIDRFLMYYISTADRLTRTSTWLDKLDGGIAYLREVVVDDRLGICAELEHDMQQLVDGYHCEWAEVVNNPELRARFRHFADATEKDAGTDFVIERGQRRPADWPRVTQSVDTIQSPNEKYRLPVLQTSWVPVARVEDVPKDGGIAIKHGNAQIALFNFASRGQWYATQNMCPHKREQVLARGLIGDQSGDPKVACPLHKKTFSLESGKCLNSEENGLHTFPVKVQEGVIYLHLPEARLLEQLLPAQGRPCTEHEHAATAAE